MDYVQACDSGVSINLATRITLRRNWFTKIEKQTLRHSNLFALIIKLYTASVTIRTVWS